MSMRQAHEQRPYDRIDRGLSALRGLVRVLDEPHPDGIPMKRRELRELLAMLSCDRDRDLREVIRAMEPAEPEEEKE